MIMALYDVFIILLPRTQEEGGGVQGGFDPPAVQIREPPSKKLPKKVRFTPDRMSFFLKKGHQNFDSPSRRRGPSLKFRA